MPIREVIFLAFEAIYANKLRSMLTMLGIIIGVAAVVLLVSIGNGAKNYITQQFMGMGTNLIMIQPGRTEGKSSFGPPIGSAQRPLNLHDVEALEKQSFSLEAVTGVTFGMGTAKIDNRSMNAQVLGASDKFFQILNVKLQLGQILSREEADTGRKVAVIGHKVAKTLFDDANPLGQLIKILDSQHRVIGVFEPSGEKLGFNMDNMILVPTKDAMRIFNDEKLLGIRAKAKSLASINDAVAEIKIILKHRHSDQEDFTVTTQLAMLDTMGTILGMLTYVLAGIAMISMLVGGIGIMNIMLVSVTERTREIGIRRAVGARKQDILTQFIVEAMVLSVTGGLIGLGISIFITSAIYWALPDFDMRAPIWILAPSFLISLFTGVIFGVWPARSAANIETIEALRYE